MQRSYHNSDDKDNKKCPFCTEPCGYEWCPYNEEEEMNEDYDKLKTSERQLLFKVFRESNFYNFVQFLNHVEELYDGDYEKALREELRKVPKSFDSSGATLGKRSKRT